MRIFIIVVLMLAPAISFAQRSVRDASRGTFPSGRPAPRPEEEEEERRRQPNTITPSGQDLVPVVIDGRVVYVPRNKAILVPNTPQPRPQQPRQDYVQPRQGRQVIVTSGGGGWVEIGRGKSIPSVQRGWPREALGINKVNFTGAGVTIALLDSGVSPNVELNGKVDVRDITGGGNPSDENGHGTAIAGILVGGSGGRFKSVAPGARIESYKVTFQEKDLDGVIRTKTNNVYLGEAVKSILDYNKKYPYNRINVINISYGLSEYDKYLEDILRQAYDEGIVIVAAAGNKPDGIGGACGVVYPAAADFIISAGAIKPDKTFTDFSCSGTGLDFIAPGQDIFSLDNKGSYDWWSGTSYSSAYISGLAALIIQAWEGKYKTAPAPAQVYEILKKISAPLPGIAANIQGYGLPDAAKISGVI